ncbi:hypothetical protein [Dyella agri]|uniref:DUF2946 domain-containing protein n=1 Tax=Dyella agri TaxID=1926869 RepID=A0ABW8KCG2_9GAMM
MSRTATPLLTRLRRHRGLWVLALAVLLIKLVTSSVCLGDAPSQRLVAAQAAVGVAALAVDAGTDDGCLLGEAGGCHCACAHSLTVTSASVAFALSPQPERLEPARSDTGHLPAVTGSLLRPPIA